MPARAPPAWVLPEELHGEQSAQPQQEARRDAAEVRAVLQKLPDAVAVGLAAGSEQLDAASSAGHPDERADVAMDRRPDVALRSARPLLEPQVVAEP